MPAIRYQQASNERCCLLRAAASVFHHVQMRRTAKALWCLSQDEHNNMDSWKCLRTAVLEANKKQKLKATSIKRTFDPLRSTVNFLAIITLKSEDGKTDHAIGLHDNKIWDANMHKALPLTRSALDYCCSSDAVETRFVSVHSGLLFY